MNEFDSRTLRDKTGKSLENKTLEEIPEHFLRFIKFHNIAAPRSNPMMDEKEQELNRMGSNNNQYPNRGLLNHAPSLSMSQMSQSISYADIENEGRLEGYNNRNQNYDDAPLPPGWDRAYMGDGRIYYVNHKSHLTQWMVC